MCDTHICCQTKIREYGFDIFTQDSEWYRINDYDTIRILTFKKMYASQIKIIIKVTMMYGPSGW